MVDLPSAQDCVAAATKLWGKPTSRTRSEVRFGQHGSKKLDLKSLVWHDHETNEGGGAVDLLKRAGMWKPNGDARASGRTRREEFQRTHTYTDETGTTLFRVCKKWDGSWTQQHVDGHRFVPGLGTARRVLYRLPALIAAHIDATVFITEGEKDADNLAALGLTATTNPGGASKWRPEYSAFLRGRRVIILPDNDAPGAAHANVVLAALTGVAASVKIVHLPGLETKGDVSDWIANGGTLDELNELASQARGEPPAWIAGLRREGRKTVPNLYNAYHAISHDPRWRRSFRFDEMLLTTLIRESKERELTDNDVIGIQKRLQDLAIPRIGKEAVYDAIDNYARQHAFHPVRNYLNALAWDGESRIDTWTHVYLGADDTEYSRAIGAMFLIAMVARVLTPGCKADHMLILEGPQGRLKSTACKVLAGGDTYFSSSLPELGSGKDVSIHLRGKWLIEIAEMHAFNRAEATHLKSFVSETHEKYRPPFARKDVNEPRQCVFVGTSNKDTYLRDESGGRRFWPLPVGDVNIKTLTTDRDQLLAEAVTRFHNSAPWWPHPTFERAHIKPQQDARYEADAWEDRFEPFLTIRTRVTTLEVATECLAIPIGQISKSDQMRIASILQRLGWEQRRSKTARWWEKTTLLKFN